MEPSLVLKEVKEVKPLFLSKTFLAICFTTVAALAPLVGNAIKEKKLSVDNGVQIVLVLAGAGTAIVGRAAANNSLVYTPDGIPGANRTDILPVPEAQQGQSIEGTINEEGIAAVSEVDPAIEPSNERMIDYLDRNDLFSDAIQQQLDKKDGI